MAFIDVGAATALIDDEDVPLIKGLTLRLRVLGNKTNPLLYVEFKRGGRTRSLHRLIMGDPKGYFVDHINGNCLDNRRCNLRVCSHAENMQNRRTHSNNRCGIKGVYFDHRRQHYRATIRVFNKKVHLGCFATPQEAALAYAAGAAKFHGEFAKAA